MRILNKLAILAILLISLNGCATFGTLPTVLTSKEQQWTIPAGVEFQAIQKPAYPKLTKFLVSDDLAVIYKGSLLELEQEANLRATKAARASKREGLTFGTIAGLLTSILGFLGKNKLFKRKEGKNADK